MSFSRQLLREFRPLFRMLEEPISGRGPYMGLNRTSLPSLFDFDISRSPAIDIREEGSKYLLEAELPGVKKEDIEVRVGDAGRSITIEGKVAERRTEPQSVEAPNTTVESTETPSSTAVTNFAAPTGNQLSTERTFTSNSTFRRMVWLPRPVDTNNVTANLDHGILTIAINKAEDKASVVVPIQ